jgi:hypothetical protein
MSGAVVIEAQSKVLEDKDDALLPEPKIGDGEEVVELHEPAKKPEAKPAAEPAAKPAAAAPAKTEDDDTPEELRGKSPAQLAKMYKDAQSLIGRQGQELGELRKKADSAIMAGIEALRARKEPTPAAKPEPEPVEIDESEIFAKPKDAISKLIENHPLIKEIKATLGKSASEAQVARATAATERFNQAHPDSQEILADPDFRKWVAASPVRKQLLLRANNQFDFDAGDEVFSTWKALKGVGKAKDANEGDGQPAAAAAAPAGDPDEAAVKAAAQVMARASAAKKAKDAAAQAAAAPTGGASAGKDVGAKKVYRRADVLRLMEEDPERYERLAPEIELAYREGRVR